MSSPTGPRSRGGSSARADLADILVQIVHRRTERLQEARREDGWQATWSPPALDAEPAPRTAASNRFLAGIEAQRGRAIIAEVKMGSPSLGSLADSVDPLAQARAYARGEAAALSVVVEPDFFHGSYELLAACAEASGLPAVAKDFIVDPLQIEWARRAGASAVLLIAALYAPDELRDYAAIARACGLVPLIETHDADDVAKLDGADWELVGINNRDLRTFTVDLEQSMALVPSLPVGALKVAESGIHEPDDLAGLRAAGFDAYLIGESLLTSGDPLAKLDALRGAA
ncbi:MAG: indole-3-glycerol phosphate synthase TrpC [Acidobacteriota bacterium]